MTKTVRTANSAKIGRLYQLGKARTYEVSQVNSVWVDEDRKGEREQHADADEPMPQRRKDGAAEQQPAENAGGGHRDGEDRIEGRSEELRDECLAAHRQARAMQHRAGRKCQQGQAAEPCPPDHPARRATGPAP